MSKNIGKGVGKGHGGNTANLPMIRPNPVGQANIAHLIASGHIEADAKVYKAAKLSIILGTLNGLYHLSISHPDRYPTWDEVAYIRYELTPSDIDMVMFLPKKEDYINIHNFCFQLHQLKDGC